MSRERLSQFFAVLLSLLLIAVALVLLGGFGLMVWKVVGGGEIKTGNPVNTIFHSRLMVLAARLAILMFIGYAIYSMALLMRWGVPLGRIGPVQVAQGVSRLDRAVQTVTAERDALSETLDVAVEEIDRLRNEVADLTERLQLSDHYLDLAMQEIARLGDPEAGAAVDDS